MHPMGSRDSWIDLDELSALGHQLMGEAKTPLGEPSNAAAGEGGLPAEMIDRWRRQLVEIRGRAEKSGLLGDGSGPEVTSEVLPEVFVPPVEGTLMLRMRAFESWLDAEVRPRIRFGADDLGFPILGPEGEPALVAIALSLCHSWHTSGSRTMGSPSAVASRVLDDLTVLTIFPQVEGETFRFVAVVTGNPLAADAAARISAAFRAALGGEGISPLEKELPSPGDAWGKESAESGGATHSGSAGEVL